MWIHSIAPFVDNKYCQQMDVKQDGMHIVICPKQGNNIEGVVLHSARVSNLQWLTYTQILVE